MKYRRFESSDRMPVYRMFRESIWDYMLQNGVASPDEEYDIDELFQQQQGLYVHLEQNASEDWVAEDDELGVVGWARSIERDDHLQLSHFFVSPLAQGKGVGHQLLDTAFSLGRGQQRSIIATTNTRALSLYLRYDVSFRGMAFSLYGEPRQREINSDLEIELIGASDKALQQVLHIESQVLGYKRPEELEFYMHTQPLYLFRRDNQIVAYAFGSTANSVGPAAALCPEDMPVLLQVIEQSACRINLESLWLTIPANAKYAINWALTSGYKIDPFYEVLLAKKPSMQLDRYLMTQSAFVW